ncbi:MAG: hypothetical protein R3F07_12415 [Opitutaceae bacterium]
MKSSLTRPAPALMGLLLVLSGPASGQVTVSTSEYIFGSEIELGGFWPALSTEIRLDSNDGQTGTGVDFENDLDYSDRKALPMIQGSWRASKSWLFQIDYINLDRSNSKILEKEIHWPPGEDGETFPVGVRVNSFLNFEASRISAAYVVRTSKESELAVSLGFHLTRFSSGIGLAVSGGGQEGSVAADVELPLVPLPTLGLYWGIRMSEKWALRLRGDYFALTYDNYSGSLISTRADIVYEFAEHWGFGAGMN